MESLKVVDGISEEEKQENPEFFKLNDRGSLEEDVFLLFDALMKAGVDQFYVHQEPGKKRKKKTTRMFGRVDYGNVGS